MADNRRQIELALEVTAAGLDSINKLRSDVKDLADQGDLAAPVFKRLDSAIAALAEQAKQLQVLEELAPSLKEAAAAQQVLADRSAELGAEVQSLGAKTKDAKDAQAAANLQYKEAVNKYQEALQAVKTFKAGLSDEELQLKTNRDTLRTLNVAVADAQKTKNEYKLKVEQSTQAVRQSAAAQAEAGQAFRASEAALKGATKELNGLERQAATASKSLQQAGGATGDMADSQAALQKALTDTKAEIKATIAINDALAASDRQQAAEAALAAANSKRAYEQMSAAAKAEADGIIADFARLEQSQREAAAASKAAGEAITEAFRTVGGRGAAEIRDEIERIRQAMNLLAQSGALTGKELDNAMRLGNASIKALERDLREATGTMTMMDRATGLLKSTVGQLGAFIGLTEVIQRTGTAFWEATKSIQSMQLGLKAVYGDADTASKQIAFLRETANTAGISVQELASAFTRFSASTTESNVPIAESNALFGELVRVSGLLGLSSTKAEQALEAVSQMAAKGYVSLEELRQQLGDAIPGATALAAKGLGITQEELYKMVEAGNLSARQFIPAFTAALKTLEGQNTTLAGAVARVSNAITEFYQSASDSAAIKALTSGLNALAANFGTVVDVVYGLGKALLALKIIDYVKNLSLFSSASKQAAADIGTQTAATVANTVQTKLNTTAVVENTAAKRANALAGASVGSAAADASKNTGVLGKTLETAAGVMGLFGRAAGGVFRLLGGWPMLLATVAMNYKELGTWIGETAARMTGWGKVMDDANRKLEESAKREKELAQAKVEAGVKAEQAIAKEVSALTQAREALDSKTAADEKATEAAKKQAEVVEKLADLRGNEQAKLQAATEATNIQLAAAQQEATDKQALVAAIEAELAKRQELMAASVVVTEKMKEEAQKLQELLDKKRAEADASAAAAQALQFEAAQREITAQAYQDNAANVELYRQRLEGANQSLAAVLEMERQGLPVAQAVIAARLEQAAAERLFNDAVSDKKQQIELANAAAQAESDLATANLTLRKAELTNMLESAKARGDSNMVQYASIELKQVEIELLKLAVKSDILRQESIIAVAKAQLQQLSATNELTPAKKLELEITMKQAEAEMVLAKARGAQIENLQREAQALRENTANTEANSRASRTVAGDKDREAGSRDKNAGAIDKENAALAKQNELRKVGNDYVNKQGMVTDSKGSVLTGMATALETLQLKQRAGTLSSADLDLAKAAMEQEYAKYQMYASFKGTGLGSIQGNIRGGYDQAKSLYEELLAQESRTSSATRTTSTATRTASTSGGTTRTQKDAEIDYYKQVLARETDPSTRNMLEQYIADLASGKAKPGNSPGIGGSIVNSTVTTDSSATVGEYTLQLADAIKRNDAGDIAELKAEIERLKRSVPTPVTINLNGVSTKINVGSQTDVDALQRLLQQLQSGATRTI